MAINWAELTPEEVIAKAQELEKESAQQARDIEALSNKKTELLVETKKQKKAIRLLQERGIDPRSPDYEDRLAELLASIDEAKEPKQSTQQSPGQVDPTNPDGTSNSQSVNPEIKAMLDRMAAQVENLTNQINVEKQEKDQLKKQMEEDHIKNTVIEKLRAMGATKPHKAEQLFGLTKNKYKLAEDGKTVFSGDEYDIVSLETVIDNLKNSDEYGDYFVGSGNSGSGMHNSGSAAISNGRNPFAKGGNATEAAALMASNPDRGRMLLAQARASGNVDPIMDRAFPS